MLRVINEVINIIELKNTAKKMIRVVNETVSIVESIVNWVGTTFPRNLKRIIILIRDRK